MKIVRPYSLRLVLAACALSLAISNSQAQQVIISHFDSASDVSGPPWNNWFGTAYLQAIWSSSDANNNPNSGSLELQAVWPDAQVGGCCGPQFVLYNGNNGITPSLNGNGNSDPTLAIATNLEFDVRFAYDDGTIAAASPQATNCLVNGTNWPTIEVGTRGVDFGQHDFATFTVPGGTNNLGWTHMSIPIGPSANWTNIPNVFFKLFNATATNSYTVMFIDNIVFDTSVVPVTPPTVHMQPAKQGLRVLSGNSQYGRIQLLTVDTNQSWVGGTYPVSYSFTVAGYDVNPPINEFHLFLTPLTPNGGTIPNQYTDYNGGYNMRLQITGGAAGTSTVFAQFAWKTNLVNSNPNNVVVNITNATMNGTWTLTFTSATAGTLTAPGASPVPFTIPSDAVAFFANPLCVLIGLQPNDPSDIGQHVDFTHMQTVGVASPGVPINTDWTVATNIDTNVWTTSASAAAANLANVPPGSAQWLSWNIPDYGASVVTKESLNSSIPWKTAAFYNGSNALLQVGVGTSVFSLVPTAGLPSTDGTTNGPRSNKAFFKLSTAPSQ